MIIMKMIMIMISIMIMMMVLVTEDTKSDGEPPLSRHCSAMVLTRSGSLLVECPLTRIYMSTVCVNTVLASYPRCMLGRLFLWTHLWPFRLQVSGG